MWPKRTDVFVPVGTFTYVNLCLSRNMAEKKRFKLNGAVVNHSAMEMPMAERAVDFAIEAIRDQNTEQVCRLLTCMFCGRLK